MGHSWAHARQRTQPSSILSARAGSAAGWAPPARRQARSWGSCSARAGEMQPRAFATGRIGASWREHREDEREETGPACCRSTRSAASRWPAWSSSTTRRLGQRLSAAAAREVARLHAHGPPLSLLPLHRRCVDHAFAWHGGRPWQIVKRALIIFGLGMVLALYPRWDVSIVRIPGVLQRIAVCYLIAAFLFRWSAPAHGNDDARRMGMAGRCFSGPWA